MEQKYSVGKSKEVTNLYDNNPTNPRLIIAMLNNELITLLLVFKIFLPCGGLLNKNGMGGTNRKANIYKQ